MKALGVRFWPEATVTAVNDGSVTVKTATGIEQEIACGTVVEALDCLPERQASARDSPARWSPSATRRALQHRRSHLLRQRRRPRDLDSTKTRPPRRRTQSQSSPSIGAAPPPSCPIFIATCSPEPLFGTAGADFPTFSRVGLRILWQKAVSGCGFGAKTRSPTGFLSGRLMAQGKFPLDGFDGPRLLCAVGIPPEFSDGTMFAKVEPRGRGSSLAACEREDCKHLFKGG